ncbi:MAG: carboxylating nicotinate-nucleotide diphosphorylase [Proteobacteria bacterium]|nr:carboxylating nicotinate-nucleotide diphosphorylase [Pseudomonadota bacterium]
MPKVVAFLDEIYLRELAQRCLMEDIPTRDITTTSCVEENLCGEAMIISRQSAVVVAGLKLCEVVFQLCDVKVEFTSEVEEGACLGFCDVEVSQASVPLVIATVRGRMSALLKAERVALNLLARLCAVATASYQLSEKLTGYKAQLLDTRKTTPGLKLVEKYASAVGGAQNHRYHLSDGVLIKDNHLLAAGGITQAIQRVRRCAPISMKIEIEVTSFLELKEALDAGADMIMLDNMSCEDMAKCVKYVAGAVPLEASGGISLASISSVAQTGVDYISTSAMFRAPSVDLSMLVTAVDKTFSS